MNVKEILELIDSLPDNAELFTTGMNSDGEIIIKLTELPGNRRLAKAIMSWLRKRRLSHFRAYLHRDLLREHYKNHKDSRDGYQSQIDEANAELILYEDDPDIQDMK